MIWDMNGANGTMIYVRCTAIQDGAWGSGLGDESSLSSSPISKVAPRSDGIVPRYMYDRYI